MRILIALLFLPLFSFSQEGIGYKLWIGFSDKGSITNSTYSASDLFSERSIARREKQNISIDYTDYPISSDYLSILKNLNFEVLNKSKWFNGLTALQSDTNAIDSLLQMNFIQRIDTLGYFAVDTASRYASKFDGIVIDENTHAAAKNQIEMIWNDIYSVNKVVRYNKSVSEIVNMICMNMIRVQELENQFKSIKYDLDKIQNLNREIRLSGVQDLINKNEIETYIQTLDRDEKNMMTQLDLGVNDIIGNIDLIEFKNKQNQHSKTYTS